jgi:selenocysteine-specific elongation factor
MRRFVVGTAGHVDHGKTTLVRALTGVDTDRLAEEKRRGITIELGFAPLKLADDLDVSIIDVPGHRKLVHTMIAGAVGMELVLLVVAADEGVMPQTREHVAACELLGIRRAVVALTKVDRADADLVELARQDVTELLAGRFEHVCVPCSARTGEGLDALREALSRALRALPAPEASARARLAVDRVFTVKGAGAVVTGTIVRGALSVGERLRIVGPLAERGAEVRGLHVHDHAVDRADAPTRLAINLGGIGHEDVHRGDVVTTDPYVGPTRRFDAELVLHTEPKPRAALEVYAGTRRVVGRLRILEPSSEEHRALGRLTLSEPLVVTGGDRFVLRMGSHRGADGAVIGGGSVLDTAPPTRRDKALRASCLRAVIAKDAATAARSLATESAPRPLTDAELERRLGDFGHSVRRAAEKLADRGELSRLKDEGFVDRAAVLVLAERARKLTREHHESHPLDRGIPLETLRRQLLERTSAGVAAEAIRWAAKNTGEIEPLLVVGDVAKSADFVEGLGAGGPLDGIRQALEEAALKGLGEHAVTELVGAPIKEVRAMLAKLVRDGAAVSAGGQWFLKESVDALRARLLDHFAKSPVLTIAEFKELSGLGRKQAIPLLELFDREGTSLRKGDDRVRGPNVGRA